jgi:DnaK suppressor protein
METYQEKMAPRFAALLASRAEELRQLLQSHTHAQLDGGDADEADDFKAIADARSLSAVSDAQAAHAARELEEVLAAARRVATREYGTCVKCGVPIPLARLEAAPGTANCTSCQSALEAH